MDKGYESPHDYNARITKLEAVTSQLADALVTLTNDVREGFTRLNERGQTNWQIILTAVGLVVVIGGLVMAPVYTNQSRQLELLDKLAEAHMKHVKDGHPHVQSALIAENEGNIDRLVREGQAILRKIEELHYSNLEAHASKMKDIATLQQQVHALERSMYSGLDGVTQSVNNIEKEQDRRISVERK